ncbi:MAG: hypothetical protein QXL69_02415 [Candidatus Bathyarchaeia archaeon]
MWWGRGRRRSGAQAGPWPGAGSFSYLPPWQRPGWIYGKGAFNSYTGYSGTPASTGYIPTSYTSLFIQREPYYQRSTSYYFTQTPPSISYSLQLMRSTPIHMNCVHFSNGICTLKGIYVSPNGFACTSFTPKI